MKWTNCHPKIKRVHSSDQRKIVKSAFFKNWHPSYQMDCSKECVLSVPCTFRVLAWSVENGGRFDSRIRKNVTEAKDCFKCMFHNRRVQECCDLLARWARLIIMVMLPEQQWFMPLTSDLAKICHLFRSWKKKPFLLKHKILEQFHCLCGLLEHQAFVV